jgi:16S rRNA C1402 (ribose-2'-O) methylase RsmI
VGAATADAGENWTEEKVEKLLKDMMANEAMSVKDAAAFVAAKTGWKKSDVYQKAVLLKNGKK